MHSEREALLLESLVNEIPVLIAHGHGPIRLRNMERFNDNAMGVVQRVHDWENSPDCSATAHCVGVATF